MMVATVILIVVGGYVLAGLVFGVAFVVAGAPRLDAAARGGPVSFRLMILSGAVALWPWLAVQWMRAARDAGDGSEGGAS